jgi:integrase/recombinase XerD
VRRRSSPQSKQLDAGPFEAEVGSFWLHLAAEGKAGRTIGTYTEAVRWFAAAHLLPETGKTRWEQVDRQDVQRWAVRLLDRYSPAYASNQFRAVRRFLRWLAAEQDRPDPVAGLRAAAVTVGLVPVFTSEELSALRRACQGRSFADRRDAAVMAVFGGDWHPAVGASRDPPRPGRARVLRPGPAGPGDPGPRQGRPAAGSQDQFRGRSRC